MLRKEFIIFLQGLAVLTSKEPLFFVHRTVHIMIFAVHQVVEQNGLGSVYKSMACLYNRLGILKCTLFFVVMTSCELVKPVQPFAFVLIC